MIQLFPIIIYLLFGKYLELKKEYMFLSKECNGWIMLLNRIDHEANNKKYQDWIFNFKHKELNDIHEKRKNYKYINE